MEVFRHFVFPRFSGFFRAFPFVYRLFRAFLFTILFRHFVLPPILGGKYERWTQKVIYYVEDTIIMRNQYDNLIIFIKYDGKYHKK
jgi:hypothetical protein